MKHEGVVFIGMETSGAMRRAMQARGFETYSCDTLPSEDNGERMAYNVEGAPMGCHLVGDVFQTLEKFAANGKWPVAAVFHPTCTYLTTSAEWAYSEGPYHMNVGPDVLTGAERKAARESFGRR